MTLLQTLIINSQDLNYQNQYLKLVLDLHFK